MTMRCALIEYNIYHDITFPMFVYLLRRLQIQVDIYTPTRNIARNVLFDTDTSDVVMRRTDARLFGVKEFLTKYRAYDFVIMNSLEPKQWLQRAAALDAPTLALLHDAHVYQHDDDYKRYFAKRNRKIIVLWKHLADYLSSVVDAYCCSPVYFGETSIQKVENAATFCAQGVIQYCHRNYPALLTALEELTRTGDAGFLVRIVGGIGTADLEKFLKESHVKQVDSFIELIKGDISYHAYLSAIGSSHFLLPLLDTTHSDYLPFQEDKMTTSIPCSVGLGAIPIIHQDFAKTYGIEAAAITYENGGLSDAMRRAIAMNDVERTQKRKALRDLKHGLLEQSLTNLRTAIETF